MKKLRVMMLVHWDLVPPDDLQDEDDPRMEKYATEFDVRNALWELGHEVEFVPIESEIAPIRQMVEQWQPHIAFNLLEDFAGYSALDYYVVSYLDMLHVPYTGCNPRGLLLARDKALSKKILSYHRIKVPKFAVFPYGKKIKKTVVDQLPYPMIVKSLIEQGSVGIAQASYVTNQQELTQRVEQLHEMLSGDVIAEQYIEGRELYVAVVGNQRLEVLPVRELIFGKVEEEMPRMATYKVKWDPKYRERWGIDYDFVRPLPLGMPEQINRLCKRIYRNLDLSGYARMDLRLTEDGQLFLLEANPNPAISNIEEVAYSAEKAGYTYALFIQKIINLGLKATRYYGSK
jgi:D-alanine-D-alanine ligase